MEMNAVQRVRAICKNRKIPISRLERDLGFANGYISQLRKGTFPNDRLVQISTYLGVPVEYLMEGSAEEQKEKPTTQEGDELREDIQNFTAFLQGCSEEETRALFAMSQAFLANLRQGPSAPKEED